MYSGFPEPVSAARGLYQILTGDFRMSGLLAGVAERGIYLESKVMN
jgi:hypothetical protein